MVENPSDQDNQITKSRAVKDIWEIGVGNEINKEVCKKHTAEYTVPTFVLRRSAF
jgi:hypothetical protein